MIAFNLSEVARELSGRVVGDDVSFNSISTDSRQIKECDLFIALKGDQFDGHDYVDLAEQQQAVATLVDHEMKSGLPQVVVEDTRLGLGKLAAAWRQKSSAVVIGITGSNGKTTLKELIASILAEQDSVLATRGNFNNDIGLPLTLTRLQDEQFAVIEMGANHSGEIDYLSAITNPDIAVLNNAGRAHLEGFGSLEGVAKAKLEIINGLSDDGTFIYNADDDFAALWQASSTDFRCMTFAVEKQADVNSDVNDLQVEWLEDKAISTFSVSTPRSKFNVSLSLLGEHNRMNALAAIAVAEVLEIPIEKIQLGLAAVKPVKGRLYPCSGLNGCRVIDDSYNANPDSVRAAINVLKTISGNKILILGDLAELGEDTEDLYKELGKYAAEVALNQVLTVGIDCGVTSKAFGKNGKHFTDKESLLESVKNNLNKKDVVLVKGSRSAAMEEVVDCLTTEAELC